MHPSPPASPPLLVRLSLRPLSSLGFPVMRMQAQEAAEKAKKNPAHALMKSPTRSSPHMPSILAGGAGPSRLVASAAPGAWTSGNTQPLALGERCQLHLDLTYVYVTMCVCVTCTHT